MKTALQLLLSFLLTATFSTNTIAQTPICNWVTASTGTSSNNLQLNYGNGGMKTDSAGNLYFVGTFSYGTFQLGSLSVKDTTGNSWFYIGKINAAGHPVWLKSISASGANVRAIAVNSSGNFVISGDFRDTVNLDATHQLVTASSSKFFLAAFDSSGALLWDVTPITTNGYNQAFGLSLDDNNNTYCTGYFTGTLQFDTTLSTTYNAVFTAKFDANGNRLWIRSADVLDASSLSTGLNIAASGNDVYVTGYLGDSTSFATNPVTKLISYGVHDIFMAKYTTGGHIEWAKNVGGRSTASVVYGLSVNGHSQPYIDGTFQGANGVFGSDSVYGHSGVLSGFIVKCDSSGNVLWANYANCSTYAVLNDIASDTAGNTVVAGTFSTLNLTVSSGKTLLTTIANKGLSDGFLLGFNNNGKSKWTKSFASGSYETCDQVCLKNKHLTVAGSLFDSLTVDGFSFNAYDTTQLFFAQMTDTTTTGIFQVLANKDELTIYPNPTNGSFTISSSENMDDITVTNLLGQTVFKTLLNTKQDLGLKQSIDLSAFSSGLYFVTCSYGDHATTLKLVVTK